MKFTSLKKNVAVNGNANFNEETEVIKILTQNIKIM